MSLVPARMGELIGTPTEKHAWIPQGIRATQCDSQVELGTYLIYLVYLPSKPRGAATCDGSGIVGSFAVGVSTQLSSPTQRGTRELCMNTCRSGCPPRYCAAEEGSASLADAKLMPQTAEHLAQWSHMPCRFIATLRPLPVPDKRHAQAK